MRDIVNNRDPLSIHSEISLVCGLFYRLINSPGDYRVKFAFLLSSERWTTL